MTERDEYTSRGRSRTVDDANVIVKFVEGTEQEGPLGTILSSPPHWVVAWGEYADQGEADGEVRVMAAVDDLGRDITDDIASLIGGAIRKRLEEGL